MVRVSRINRLNVLMNGLLVGQWHNLPNGATAFQYADEWLATPGARPISLSLPMRQQAFAGEPILQGMIALAQRHVGRRGYG